MNQAKFLTLLLLVLFVFACGPDFSEEQLQKDGMTLAELQCAAKKLKDERFKLADDIRFLQDSLIILKADTMRAAACRTRLDSLQGTTEEMWRRTKIMADSVNHTLERLQKETYHSKAARKQLDAAQEKAFGEICR